LNVLAVGAHPDDIELGCFGVMAKHHLRGDKIFGVIITNGELGFNAQKRIKESLSAAKQIDMNLIFGEFPDGNLQENSALVSFLDNIIKKKKINVMYTHTEHDRHQDHISVAKACISAGRKLSELYSYETPSVIYGFHPQLFVDITNTLQKKILAIKKHKSQKNKIYTRVDATKGIAKFRAYQCGLPKRFCEAFEVHKIVNI